MASPTFTFAGAAGSLQKKSCTAGGTAVATLDDLSGVTLVQWSIESTDETTVAGDFTLTLSGAKNSVCTVSGAGFAAGKAALLQCKINSGVDPLTGDVDLDRMTRRAKFFVPTTEGLEVGCFDEEDESSSGYWWIAIVNAAIRYLSTLPASTVQSVTGTAPITVGGTAEDPVVGISAASGAGAGSMSASHFSAVDGRTSAATVSTIMARDAAGRSKVVAPSAADDIATKSSSEAAATSAAQNEANLRTAAAALTATLATNGQVVTAPGVTAPAATDVTFSVDAARAVIVKVNSVEVARINSTGIVITGATKLISIDGLGVAREQGGAIVLASTSGETTIEADGVARFDVNGSLFEFSMGGMAKAGAWWSSAFTEKSANYTLTVDDDGVFVDCTSGNKTISLPSAVGLAGREFTVVRVDASGNTLTVDPDGGETINGAASRSLNTQYKSETYKSNGANWYVKCGT